MRNPSLTLALLLLTLLAATLTLATPSAEPAPAPGKAVWGGYKGNSDWGKSACLKRAPNVQRAIELYCRPRDKNGGFRVPGAASITPKTVGRAIVSITGGCNPAQWLPWDICFKQFYSMCVSGNGRGESNRVYGNKRCQTWRISNPK